MQQKNQGQDVFGGPYKLFKKSKTGSGYGTVISVCIMIDNRIQERTFKRGSLTNTSFSKHKYLNAALTSAISKLETLMQKGYHPVERIDLVTLRDMV